MLDAGERMAEALRLWILGVGVLALSQAPTLIILWLLGILG